MKLSTLIYKGGRQRKQAIDTVIDPNGNLSPLGMAVYALTGGNLPKLQHSLWVTIAELNERVTNMYACYTCPVTNERKPLYQIIIELNDLQRWSTKEIRIWLRLHNL